MLTILEERVQRDEAEREREGGAGEGKKRVVEYRLVGWRERERVELFPHHACCVVIVIDKKWNAHNNLHWGSGMVTAFSSEECVPLFCRRFAHDFTCCIISLRGTVL